jgi:nicotinamidase-related amidase
LLPGAPHERSSPRVHPREHAALIVVDAKNDFISEGGKAWPNLKDVIEQVGTVEHMKRLLDASRTAGVHVMHAPMETNAPRWPCSERGVEPCAALCSAGNRATRS